MPHDALRSLALLGVVALITFLAYGPQILFHHIEPYALEQKQAITFNVLVGCILITYTRACVTNPGWVPPSRKPDHSASNQSTLSKNKLRWCKKCEALKPPRAHHCRTCQRWRKVLYFATYGDFWWKSADVYQRWITIARGQSIVSLIVPFLISSASYSMQRHQWYILNTSFASE